MNSKLHEVMRNLGYVVAEYFQDASIIKYLLNEELLKYHQIKNLHINNDYVGDMTFIKNLINLNKLVVTKRPFDQNIIKNLKKITEINIPLDKVQKFNYDQKINFDIKIDRRILNNFYW